MTEVKDVATRVRKEIADQLSVDAHTIKDNARITDDLGADSLDVVELVMKLEEEFEIEISDEDAAKLSTVQNVVDYVQTKLTDRDATSNDDVK